MSVVRSYEIDYQVPNAARAAADTDALAASLTRLDAIVTTLEPKLNRLGRRLPALMAAAAAASVDLTSKVGTLDAVATKADVPLQALGKGTAAKLRATARAAEAADGKLAGMAATAGTAQTALAGVGSTSVRISGNLGTAAGQTDLLTGAMTRLFGVHAMLQALKAVIGEIGKAITEAREASEKKGDDALDLEGKAREYANLKGRTGPDDQTMGEVFQVALASGMSAEDSIKFLEQFEGSAPAGMQKGHLTEELKGDIAKEGAVFAERVGLDAATGGDMAGVMTQYTDLTKDKDGNALTKQQSIEKFAGQQAAIAYGLNEGRGKISTLMKSELGAAAAEVGTGRVEDLGELAAFVGVASTFSKSASGSGTKVAQMSRLLNKVDKGEGDNSQETQAARFLKEIGVGDQHGDRNKLAALKRHLDVQEAAARGAGQSFDKDAYLAQHHFGNTTERAATIGFIDNLDVLDKRIANERERGADGKGAIEANRKYLQSDVAQNKRSKARGEAARHMTGLQFKAKQIGLRNAAAELESLDLVESEKQKVADAITGGFGLKEWMGLKPETQRRIQDRMAEKIEADAQNQKIDLVAIGAKKVADLNKDVQPLNLDDPETMRRLKEAGVDVHGGGPDRVDAGIRAMARDPKKAKAMQDAAAKAGRDRVPAGGGPPNLLPAGGGALPPIPAGHQPQPGAAGPDVPGAQASVDASKLDRAADKLDKAADALAAAAGTRGRGVDAARAGFARNNDLPTNFGGPELMRG